MGWGGVMMELLEVWSLWFTCIFSYGGDRTLDLVTIVELWILSH